MFLSYSKVSPNNFFSHFHSKSSLPWSIKATAKYKEEEKLKAIERKNIEKDKKIRKHPRK